MKVTIQVDGNQVEIEVPEAATVADAVSAVAVAHVPAGQVIAAVYVNDLFWQQDWESELAGLTLSEMQSVRVETLCPEDAATDGLRDLEEILDLTTSRFEKAADDLRFGDHTRGLLVFASGADLMRDALQFVGLYTDHLGVGPSHPAVAISQEVEAKIVEALPAFEAAQQAKDWALLADVVEYEISPAIERLHSARLALHTRPVPPPPAVLGMA